jgi:hypothetical protein
VWDSVRTVLADGGPWALVSAFVLAILTGRLVPRRVHLDRISDLRAANRALEDTLDEQKEQISILLGSRKPPI